MCTNNMTEKRFSQAVFTLLTPSGHSITYTFLIQQLSLSRTVLSCLDQQVFGLTKASCTTTEKGEIKAETFNYAILVSITNCGVWRCKVGDELNSEPQDTKCSLKQFNIVGLSDTVLGSVAMQGCKSLLLLWAGKDLRASQDFLELFKCSAITEG